MVKANSLFHGLRNPFASTIIYKSRNKISIVVYVVLVSIIVDTFINQNIQVRNAIGISSTWGIALFITLTAIAMIGQFYILRFVKHKSREIRSKAPVLNISFKITAVVQCLLVAIFLFVVAEMVIYSHYSSASLAVVTAVSYGLNIGLMAIFAKIFFSWYKSNRSSITVLLYGLSFAVVVITSCAFLTGNFYRFIEKPTYIFPYEDIGLTKSEPGSILNMLGKIYHYSDIVSFALKWARYCFPFISLFSKDGKSQILDINKFAFIIFPWHLPRRFSYLRTS